MVKVLEQHNLKCTCRKCKSVLEYVKDDVLKNVKVNMDYLGDYDLIDAIKCPVCGYLVRI